MNLSKQTLTTTELNLLDLGLSFIPTISRVNYTSIQKSLYRLTRSIKLRDYFDDDDEEPSTYNNKVKTFTNPSDWEPRDEDLAPTTKKLISKLHATTESILLK